MLGNFQRCYLLLASHEGGWSDDPRDNGGATMRGITLSEYRAYSGNPNVTKEQLKAEVTPTVAAAIFKRDYWDFVKGDKLPAGVDYAVFDYGVNSGNSRSAKALQKIVGVKQDGRIGPATLAAVAKFSIPDLIKALCDARLTFLQGLDDFDHFGRGWVTRVSDVMRDSLTMAAEPAGGPPSTMDPPFALPPDVEPTVAPPVRPVQPDDPTPGGLTQAQLDDLAAKSGCASLIANLFRRGNKRISP